MVAMVTVTPPSRRRRGGGGIVGVVARHGGPIPVLIMGVTVGGLIILLLIQGSLFWPSTRTSAGLFSFGTVSKRSNSKADNRHHLKGKQKWDANRMNFMEDIKTSKDICPLLPRRSSAKKLWTQYIGAILAASKHPDDPQFLHEDWMKRLLAELPPHLLQSTLQDVIPDLSRPLEIIRKRLQSPDTAPPLRIAVVGGSFAEGEGCSIATVSIPEGSVMANPTFCAWPYRLQAFLNSIMGMDWVEVTNLSEEGTDTGFMIPLIRNWIYPKSLLPHGPDVLINAYGRYDYETYGNSGSTGNLEETIKSEMNMFLRAVQVSHPCGVPPMVIHMDDVGVALNQKILKMHHKEAFARAMQADRQDGDFAMAGHMAMTWVVAFGALEAALRHCEKSTHYAAAAADVVPIESCQDPSTGEPSCPFAVFASPQGTVTKVMEFRKYLAKYTLSSTGWEVQSDMTTGWSRKTGLVAVGTGANMVLQVKNVSKEVRYLHLMTLKSNVEPWKSGRIRFRVAILSPGKEDQALETSLEIDGYHESSSGDPEHITHHFNLDFGDNKAPIGSDIMMSLELVEGFSFKILGIMLCS